LRYFDYYGGVSGWNLLDRILKVGLIKTDQRFKKPPLKQGHPLKENKHQYLLGIKKSLFYGKSNLIKWYKELSVNGNINYNYTKPPAF
jgi:hypothetical protein